MGNVRNSILFGIQFGSFSLFVTLNSHGILIEFWLETTRNHELFRDFRRVMDFLFHRHLPAVQCRWILVQNDLKSTTELDLWMTGGDTGDAGDVLHLSSNSSPLATSPSFGIGDEHRDFDKLRPRRKLRNEKRCFDSGDGLPHSELSDTMVDGTIKLRVFCCRLFAPRPSFDFLRVLMVNWHCGRNDQSFLANPYSNLYFFPALIFVSSLFDSVPVFHVRLKWKFSTNLRRHSRWLFSFRNAFASTGGDNPKMINPKALSHSVCYFDTTICVIWKVVDERQMGASKVILGTRWTITNWTMQRVDKTAEVSRYDQFAAACVFKCVRAI